MKKEIHLDEAGTLKNFLTEREKESITHLKISGSINSKDFDVLDDMCTSWGSYDDDDNYIMEENEPPFLKILDLGECEMIDCKKLPNFTYHSKLEEVILPKNLEYTGVEMENTFEDSVFLTTVVVPETLKVFASGTFISCEKLQNINFPENLEAIEGFAFSGCDMLTNISIPKNVSKIGGTAFGYCDSLEKFEVDEKNQHFTTIDGVLFNKEKTKLVAFPCGCKNKNYIVPAGVKIIGDGSFSGANIETIVFPQSLESIESMAFRGCEKLQSLIVPDSVTEIGEVAFEFCYNLKQLKLSNNLTVLREQTFGSCGMTEMEIPASVKIIENTALGWNKNLEKLILHDGLEEIFDFSLLFTYTTKLQEIQLPKTVKKINSGIFRKNTNLKNIEVDTENPYFCTIDGSLYSKDKKRLIAICPNTKKSFVVPNGVEIIEDYVFEGFNELEEIIFPETLKEIGYRCFENCKKLKELHLPASLGSIDFHAFDDCEKLQKVVIDAISPPEITNPPHKSWKFMGDAKNVILFVPNESVNKYRKANKWKDVERIKAI